MDRREQFAKALEESSLSALGSHGTRNYRRGRDLCVGFCKSRPCLPAYTGRWYIMTGSPGFCLRCGGSVFLNMFLDIMLSVSRLRKYSQIYTIFPLEIYIVVTKIFLPLFIQMQEVRQDSLVSAYQVLDFMLAWRLTWWLIKLCEAIILRSRLTTSYNLSLSLAVHAKVTLSPLVRLGSKLIAILASPLANLTPRNPNFTATPAPLTFPGRRAYELVPQDRPAAATQLVHQQRSVIRAAALSLH